MTDHHELISIIVPDDATGDYKHRLGKFAMWLASEGRSWHQPDLAAYRDNLLDAGYAHTSVSNHLSTVRARYLEITRDRGFLRSWVAQMTDDPLLRDAFADELIISIENAIDPKAAPVKTSIFKDVDGSEYLLLRPGQTEALMAAPGVDTLRGLRDTALIATLLCTGIRESELSALHVGDLRHHIEGELALLVRKGKGCVPRLVPYGELSWVLGIIDRWLEAAGIESGLVFRGLYKGKQRLRVGQMKVYQIRVVLRSYPIMVDGNLTRIRPDDCRRTYARLMFDAGVGLLSIQDILGHSDLMATLGYIGLLDATERRPPAIYRPDLPNSMDH